ncbi:MAG: thiamine pyrophosphate-dependent enzyme [Bacteroidia bacterium]|nr:thiamine pyrophosphate-dependent enzyme [Bacteroidia bacterium]
MIQGTHPGSGTITSAASVSPEEALRDYRLAYASRQASLLGRREVLTGKAKFGIFGDGKELPQLAIAKVFRPGDIRSGYYRDQTFAFATGIATFREFFAQLFADTQVENDPHSGGRQMVSHFATRLVDKDGNWLNQTGMPISSADAAPTASQMPRITGLAQASVLYRHSPVLAGQTQFSNKGQEVVFGTIGNASCAEGHFWETLNALGVLQAPAIISIWDDEYGISVPNEFQLTKSLSQLLAGFQRTENTRGFDIYTVRAWDYEELIQVYTLAADNARTHHVPSIIHVTEVTQPQGHSTSGSHERYKTLDRLGWERKFDCLLHLREYILRQGVTTEAELQAIEQAEKKWVQHEKQEAWKQYQAGLESDARELIALGRQLVQATASKTELRELLSSLEKTKEYARRELLGTAHKMLLAARSHPTPALAQLASWRREKVAAGDRIYDNFLHSETAHSPTEVREVAPVYAADAQEVSGYQILNQCFNLIFERNPLVVAFGEDVGYLGDVNQGFADLQKKYGPLRIMDTGIREATIMGQAIGLALRGLRPIAEIQYLDYLLYGIQTLSDDLATLHYRTKGGQKAPAIIRTRGHRLEGIWHAGSPLGMMLSSLRGIHIAVPRNMVQAAAFYNTFLQGDDPAIIVEVLNGYRLKERLPDNLSQITLPLGVPEVIRQGHDVTLVTYGACCRVAQEAARQLEDAGISLEILDVRTLLPFDRHHMILDSLKKTNRIVFLDEDVPGGASAYMMQQVLEVQGGYYHLDAPPRTITAKEHRTAYADDGDYFSKPQAEHVFQAVYEIMHEADPRAYPIFF